MNVIDFVCCGRGRDATEAESGMLQEVQGRLALSLKTAALQARTESLYFFCIPSYHRHSKLESGNVSLL